MLAGQVGLNFPPLSGASPLIEFGSRKGQRANQRNGNPYLLVQLLHRAVVYPHRGRAPLAVRIPIRHVFHAPPSLECGCICTHADHRHKMRVPCTGCIDLRKFGGRVGELIVEGRVQDCCHDRLCMAIHMLCVWVRQGASASACFWRSPGCFGFTMPPPPAPLPLLRKSVVPQRHWVGSQRGARGAAVAQLLPIPPLRTRGCQDPRVSGPQSLRTRWGSCPAWVSGSGTGPTLLHAPANQQRWSPTCSPPPDLPIHHQPSFPAASLHTITASPSPRTP